jgi:hypothetical protein
MEHFSRLDASSFEAVAGFLDAADCVKIFTVRVSLFLIV